jgi:hypothetical protein
MFSMILHFFTNLHFKSSTLADYHLFGKLFLILVYAGLCCSGQGPAKTGKKPL